MKNVDVCPICKHDDRSIIGEKNLYKIFKCSNCKSIYTKKIESLNSNFDYSNYFDSGSLDIPDFVFQSLKNVVENFEAFRQNNRMLDVGCGAGTLMNVAQSLKWNIEGIEVSEAAVEHLKKRKLNVFAGTLDEAVYPDAHFDVVTAIEVIEHVDNPREVLSEIARILRPSGLLYMTTPHANGISPKTLKTKWSVISPPEHLHLFSVKGMKMLIESVGFASVKIATHGFNPVEIYHGLKGDVSTKQNNQPTFDEQPTKEFDRVKSSYKLNQWLVGGKNKKKLKDLANSALSATGLGDTLKVWAVR